MKKFFYTDGSEKFGPFSFEELKRKELSRDTKIWYYGLVNWTPISEIDELNTITKSIPPPLKKVQSNDGRLIETISVHKHEVPAYQKKSKSNKKVKPLGVLSSIVSIIAITFIYISYNKGQEAILYQKIVKSAYDADEDFDFYIDKFYRDIEAYGLFPKRPSEIIIKFARLDQIDNATHIHGVSYGMNNDNKIEIYINPSTWKAFNKPMRYYLMYHELAHDVLNVDDLDNSPKNVGKLMYPAISTYEKITMDDFIENSHALFEEVSNK